MAGEVCELSVAARLFAYTVGLAYVLLGVVGFAWTEFTGWLEADTGDLLLWFRLNPTQNLVHLGLGAVLMWAGTEPEGYARLGVAAVGAVLVGGGVAGFFLTGLPDWNVLALNLADNVLHLVTGAAALLAAASSATRAARAPARIGARVRG